MKLRFQATEIGCAEENGVFTCGVAGSALEKPRHYVMFQNWMDPENPDDEQRPHFEIDDQINGNYDLLGTCCLTRNEMIINVLYGVSWYPELSSVIVEVGMLPEEDVANLAAGLRLIYRDRPTDLDIALP